MTDSKEVIFQNALRDNHNINLIELVVKLRQLLQWFFVIITEGGKTYYATPIF
jgi:hypothetical protein